jgi:hypothetical protein
MTLHHYRQPAAWSFDFWRFDTYPNKRIPTPCTRNPFQIGQCSQSGTKGHLTRTVRVASTPRSFRLYVPAASSSPRQFDRSPE